jgi:hypothetical protein
VLIADLELGVEWDHIRPKKVRIWVLRRDYLPICEVKMGRIGLVRSSYRKNQIVAFTFLVVEQRVELQIVDLVRSYDPDLDPGVNFFSY